MKSLVWTGPRQLEMVDSDVPEPKEGELLLRVCMVGICGSELSGYLGENSLRNPPLVMGHEFSAIVTSIGKGVNNWVVGQRVTVNPLISCGACRPCQNGNGQLCRHREIIGINRPGAFAEYVTVPASACYSFEHSLEGALVEPLACAVRANNQAGIEFGDNVAIFGAGIIGLMSLKIAQIMGANQRIVIDTNERRLKKAQEWGATEVLNPSTTMIKQEVLHLCPDGVDKSIDAVGMPQTRFDSVSVVRPGGRVVFIGLHNDITELPGNLIVRQETQIAGSFCYSDEDFHRALNILKQGMISTVGDWLDIRSLSDARDSFEEQIFGPAEYPKIILKVY